jgi:hypothetical protein
MPPAVAITTAMSADSTAIMKLFHTEVISHGSSSASRYH